MEKTTKKKPVRVFDIDDVNFSTGIGTILKKFQFHLSILNIWNIRKHSGIGKILKLIEILKFYWN